MARIDLKHTTVTLRDGSTVPNEVEVGIGEGNFTWTETIEYEYLPDRGNLDDVIEGDQQPVSVDFQFKFTYLKSAAGALTPSVYEALRKIGNAASWVSSDPDACRPYAVDIFIEHTPDCPTGDNESYLFSDFRVETINPDIGGATVSASGRCNITRPTITRTPKS